MHFYRYILRLALFQEPWSLWSQGGKRRGGEEETQEEEVNELKVYNSTLEYPRDVNPTQVRVADLSKTRMCGLATAVRDILRSQYDVPRDAEWGVPAVHSEERIQPPHALAYDREDGFQCVCPQGQNGLMTCDRRARIDGSASFVTGTFGLTAASVVVQALSRGQNDE